MVDQRIQELEQNMSELKEQVSGANKQVDSLCSKLDKLLDMSALSYPQGSTSQSSGSLAYNRPAMQKPSENAQSMGLNGPCQISHKRQQRSRRASQFDGYVQREMDKDRFEHSHNGNSTNDIHISEKVFYKPYMFANTEGEKYQQAES